MPKQIESIVTRTPVRSADRPYSEQPPNRRPAAPGPPRPLVPVYELSDLAPEQRVAELRLRVMNGVYGTREAVEQVARHMLLDGGVRW